METFRTEDNTVGKYIHEDFSETSIKTVSSCDTVIDPHTRKVHHNNVDRNKVSVFVSSSAGCFMKCKFCYLTIKNSSYAKLSEEMILSNLKEAFLQELQDNPSVCNKYIKVNWMGMGEDHIVRPTLIRNVTNDFVEWLVTHNYVQGLDGVDVASTLPKNNGKWINELKRLDNDLRRFTLNPNNKNSVHASNDYPDYNQRSIVRFFYSLHSCIQETRNHLIPNALPINEAIQQMQDYSENERYNLILHHMFLNGVNDSREEVSKLLEFMKTMKRHELRILRYNTCRNNTFKESRKFDFIIEQLIETVPRLKVQISTGTEVRAACGQFIVKQWA